MDDNNILGMEKELEIKALQDKIEELTNIITKQRPGNSLNMILYRKSCYYMYLLRKKAKKARKTVLSLHKCQ